MTNFRWRCLGLLLLLAGGNARAAGWEIASVHARAGDLAIVEVSFEADARTRAGEYRFAYMPHSLAIEGIVPVEGDCTLDLGVVTTSIDLPTSTPPGRHVACRVHVRVSPAAFSGIYLAHGDKATCLREGQSTYCPVLQGAIEVDGQGSRRNPVRFLPSVPTAGQPFTAVLLVSCRSFRYFDRLYDVDVVPGRIRVSAYLQESDMGCPVGENEFRFDLPGVAAGPYRVEFVEVLGDSDVVRRTFNLAGVSVTQAGRMHAVPAAAPMSWAVLALFVAAFALSARALRTS